MKYNNCDFSGWATRVNLRCADGRTITKGAFAQNDGGRVPLVWNHMHSDPENILGHAILEDRDEGVYMYGFFNASPKAKLAKEAVNHGDVTSLSIYANQLKHAAGGFVTGGNIIEVSLVHAGANPGAFIDNVLSHGELVEDEGVIFTGEPLCLHHSAEGEAVGEQKTETVPEQKTETKPEPDQKDQTLEHKAPEGEKEDKTMGDNEKKKEDRTIQDVIDTMNEEQKTVLYSLVGAALEEKGDGDDENDNEGGNRTMKHNAFDISEPEGTVLTHSMQGEILEMAKASNIGSLRDAMEIYMNEHDELQHGFDQIESLFPEYKEITAVPPELITRDQGWVNTVIAKVHKSPFSRIRTRQMDARSTDLRGHGYKKGNQKKPMGDMSLINRTTDPQTIYVTDSLKRDDIIDITDFDVVQYQYGAMRLILNEEIAIDIMVGDGRDASDEKKVSETHVRSIWNDNELYTIHRDVDITAAKTELQGTNTGANFGENYIYAEAIITALLYAREDYKGSGTPDLFCTPHLLNMMLLARDLNGRRIYNNKDDLKAAMNVGEIYTAEQFEGLERTDADTKKHKLLGILVNLSDYTVGSTKGGEITRFEDFDIKFNQYEYLLETRISGALTRIKTAVALEEPVA